MVRVKRGADLGRVDCLVIPGGESTVIGGLLERRGLLNQVRERVREGMPVLGVCAGSVMLAKRVRDYRLGDTGQPVLGVMSIGVVRNAFGRQRESFEARLVVKGLGREVRCVFIRAPVITEVWGGAEPLSSINHRGLGEVYTLVVEDNMIASVFHTEVTGETVLHEMLVEKALEYKRR